MVKKEFKGQFKDEEVLLVFKRHPVVMRKGLILMLLAVLVGALAGMFMSRNAATVGDFFSS